MKRIKEIHDEILAIEASFHNVNDPEAQLAAKTRELAKELSTQVQAIGTRLDAIEADLKARNTPATPTPPPPDAPVA